MVACEPGGPKARNRCGQTVSCMGPLLALCLVDEGETFFSLPGTTDLCMVCLSFVSSSCHRFSPRQCRDEPQ